MRAVAYARVSSAAQRERDTIASQLRVLPEFIGRQGWTLVRPIETYVDDGRSAKAGQLERRLGLQALLRDAALGLFDVVVVVDLDRLTRSEDLTERGAILGAFQRAGVRVAAASSGQVLDLSSSMGDLFAGLQVFFAAEENRKRRERTTQGKVTAAQRGRKVGRGPYGLRYDREAARWSIDPVRGPIVREIYDRVARGESCGLIAADLTARGVPAPGDRGWNKNRVRDLVRARHPVGEWIAHRVQRIAVAVPAIVDEARWQAAQVGITANRTRGLRRTRHVYLLEGLAVCGACGAPMRIRSAHWQRGRFWRPAVYRCKNRIAGACDAPYVLTEDADARAWTALCRELEDPELPSELAADRRAIAADAHDWEADAAGFRAHLARLDKVAEAILVRFRRGAIAESALDAELAALNRERAAVRAQLRTAERARGATVSAQARLNEASATMDRLRSRLLEATPEERREIAATLIDPGGAIFSGVQIRIEFFVERPASVENDSRDLAVVSFSSDVQENRLRIRVVA